MKKLLLSGGLYTLIDDEDYQVVARYKWHLTRSGKKFYAKRQFTKDDKRIHILMHRFIMNLPNDSKLTVDHINGDGLDNRRSNLRVCTLAQNLRNRKLPCNNDCGIKGVYFDKHAKKWRARIYKGRFINIGLFDSKEYAGLAYDIYARKLFGKYARLNYPNL